MGDALKRAMVGAKTNKQTSGASDIKTYREFGYEPEILPHMAGSTILHVQP